METAGSIKMRADAGRLVGLHGVVWLRRLEANVDRVWSTISTLEGLTRFWIAPAAPSSTTGSTPWPR
jgi:hypothetical protein